jgi:hypothetical protein
MIAVFEALSLYVVPVSQFYVFSEQRPVLLVPELESLSKHGLKVSWFEMTILC